MRQKIPARADSAGPRNRRSAEPTNPETRLGRTVTLLGSVQD